MAKRRAATIITNVHPVGRVCAICGAEILNGQGAYVRLDGKGATHASAGDCRTA